MKRLRHTLLALLVGLGATTFASCPMGNLDDCFGDDTISAGQYDELSFVEQLLWEENDCGRYSRRFD